MKNYFHNYPTCPSCYAPHEISFIKKVNPHDLCENCDKIKGFCRKKDCEIYLMKEDRYYKDFPVFKCMNCEVYFRSSINFSKYPNILSAFQENNGSMRKFIPLYWNINLNEIEKSYLEWLNFEDDSIYWITWPWDDVKFMPILIAEYAFKFNNKKIVVVSNSYNKNKNIENEFYKPTLAETFGYLYYFQPQDNIQKKYKKELRKFDTKKNIIKKSKRVHFHLSPLKDNLTPQDITEDYSVYNFNLNHLKICKIINERLGNKFVKSVNFDGKKKNCRSVNQEFYEVSVDDNFDWGVKGFSFDKNGYFNILDNYDSVHKLSNSLNYVEIFDDDFDFNNQIFFIDSNDEKLFDYILEINPDTIIFSDSDKFFSDYMSKLWAKRQRGDKFINFLKNNKFCTILFSTDRSVRFLINQLEDNNLFDSTDLYKHTWDSSEVLENIESNQSHNFVFSSSLKDFQTRNQPNMKFLTVPSMEIIEKHIDEILKKIKFDKNLYYPFFKTLKTTPLPVLEDGEYPTFVYNKIYSLKSVIDKLSEIINDDKDEFEFYDLLMEPFNKIYKNCDIDNYNPLGSKIVEIINEYNDEDCKIKIISYYLQKRQLINFLNIDQYDSKVEVVTWNDLENLEVNDERIIVISTIYPFMDYDIYNEEIDTYIFIGGPNYIEYIKNVIDKRILEKEARPLEKINENAPKLLIDISSELPDISSEVKEIVDEITIDFNSTINYTKRTINQDGPIEISSRTLKKDSNAILFVDENQNGIFFPLNHVVNYKLGNKFKEHDLSKKGFKNLVGKQLFISNDYYSSNKEVFVKFMVEHGDNLRFRLNDTISFRGFKKFLEANFKWLNNFKELLSILDNRLRIQNPKRILANKIRKPIDADFDYIENVWLSDPIVISTSKGNVEIYPIDRPKNVENLIKVYNALWEDFNSSCENSEERKVLNQLELSESDAIINFQCSLNYQRYRNDFLDGKIKDELYEMFNNELNDILNSSDLFNISQSPKKVILKEDVYPFKIVQDYKKYI